MIEKKDSPDNWECQGDGTGHENHIITGKYNSDFALLNISFGSFDTFTASLSPTNFYFVPVKTSNPFEDYRQKSTKPKNSPYFRLGGSKMDLASLESFFDEHMGPNLQYLHEKHYFQDEDKLIFSGWRHA